MFSRLHMTNLAAVLLALTCVFTAGQAQAQAWPQKPIRIIVPNPAGGSADLIPRLIADQISQTLGQPVIIENRVGAAGNIGAEFVYNAEPDGYTLLAAPPPTLTINISLYPKLGYDSTKFMPVSVMATVSNVLMVHPSLPVNTVEELIAYAKANPQKLTYASQGSGSTAHLTAELFKMKAGVNLTHVPYKGDAPAITDLLAGRVDMMFGNIGATAQHIRSGRLRVLAVTSKTPLAALPGVRAMNDIVPGVVSTTWFGVVAPPKTPVEITQKLSAAIAQALHQPSVVKRLAEFNSDPVGNTPDEMAAYMKEDMERWRAVIKAGKLGVD